MGVHFIICNFALTLKLTAKHSFARIMKIAIVGTGYVGLVTGTCFAEVGIDVTCVDVDQIKIDKLNQGIIPIYEPGLEEIVHRNMEKKRLHFTTRIEDALPGCEVIFIAVGTPPDEDGSADLQYVIAVSRDIGRYMYISTTSGFSMHDL